MRVKGRWWTASGFHEKINAKQRLGLLRKGARQTVKEIAFQFDIGVETITKFKLQKKKWKFIHEKWVARHEKCVRLSAE